MAYKAKVLTPQMIHTIEIKAIKSQDIRIFKQGILNNNWMKSKLRKPGFHTDLLFEHSPNRILIFTKEIHGTLKYLEKTLYWNQWFSFFKDYISFAIYKIIFQSLGKLAETNSESL